MGTVLTDLLVSWPGNQVEPLLYGLTKLQRMPAELCFN